jgi:hypothetical protein
MKSANVFMNKEGATKIGDMNVLISLKLGPLIMQGMLFGM